MRPVLITRVQPQATAWVRQLKELGYPAQALPLIEVAGLLDTTPLRQAWGCLHQFQAVMLVSAQAVRHFFASKPPQALDVKAQDTIKIRFWCTGPGTRKALLDQGVAAAQIDSPASTAAQLDSEALWAVVAPQVRAGGAFLIVRGCDEDDGDAATEQGSGREWLSQQLQDRGAKVQRLGAYRRVRPAWSDTDVQRASLGSADGSAWVFSSAQAVQNLQALLPQISWHQACAVATHERIGQRLCDLGFAQVRLAQPSLTSVVASIESLQ